MNLLCKYYSNPVRLANSVQYLSTQPSFRFFCVSGMIVKNKKSYDVLTDTVTLVVACVPPGAGKNSLMLFTNDPALKERDGQPVDMSTIEPDPVYYNLCVLLQEKFKMSHNPLTVEFRGDKMVVAVSISEDEDGELKCSVHGMDGDIVVRGMQNIRSMLGHCQTVHAFKYATSTSECQREVAVKGGRTDILREVSRYLSRTLVLVSLLPDGGMMEQYVSTSALLEVTTRQDGTKVYRKINNNRLREASTFCIYQTVMSVEDIIREQGRALSTGRK